MFRKINWLFIMIIALAISHAPLLAQDRHVPLNADLERNAEQLLLKIGMVNKKNPPKIKFGPYSTEEREGKHTHTERLRFNGPGDMKQSLEFRFTVINKNNDSVFVEAYSEGDPDKGAKEFSIYMATSIDPEEFWIMMLSTSTGSNDISLSSMVMTDGTKEISFNNLSGMASGKPKQSASKGIEVILENQALGAMQYDSGATFGYRKYIWINQKANKQMQLLAASIFSALLEVGGYFEKAIITD